MRKWTQSEILRMAGAGYATGGRHYFRMCAGCLAPVWASSRVNEPDGCEIIDDDGLGNWSRLCERCEQIYNHHPAVVDFVIRALAMREINAVEAK